MNQQDRSVHNESEAGAAPGLLSTNAAIAASYTVTGWLGLALAMSPGFATVVWPPSGIALAAVLLRGPLVWPGIALGSLAITLGAHAAAHTPPTLTDVLGQPILACLQALLGGFLVRRFGRFPNPLDTPGRVGRLMLFGAILPALPYALCRAGILTLVDRIPASDLAFAVGSLWAGRTIGVLIFAPLVLAWWAPSPEQWRARRGPITLWLAVSFIVTGLAAGYVASLDRANLRSQFDELAASMAAQLGKTTALYIDATVSLEALQSSAHERSSEEFLLFARLLKILKDIAEAAAGQPLSNELFAKLAQRKGQYDPQLFARVVSCLKAIAEGAAPQVIELPVASLTAGQVVLSDVRLTNGHLIIPGHTELSQAQIARLHNLRKIFEFVEPVRVRA